MTGRPDIERASRPTGASCSPSATACSGRCTTPRTPSRRPCYGRGGPPIGMTRRGIGAHLAVPHRDQRLPDGGGPAPASAPCRYRRASDDPRQPLVMANEVAWLQPSPTHSSPTRTRPPPPPTRRPAPGAHRGDAAPPARQRAAVILREALACSAGDRRAARHHDAGGEQRPAARATLAGSGQAAAARARPDDALPAVRGRLRRGVRAR